MNWSEIRSSHYYRIVLIIMALLALALLFYLGSRRFLDPQILYFDDFIEYWTAGRLNLTQGNPYNPIQIEALQVQLGRLEWVPLMMWNPPWTLALVMPFALLDYAIGRMAWLLLSLAILCFVADWLWRFYGGAPERRWVAWVIACTFGPALQVLKFGQIAPLMLLGLTLFLSLTERDRWFGAGMAAALWLIKPQLLYLVGLVLVFWIIQQRRYALLLGGALALGAALAIAWVSNPSVLQQYLVAVLAYPPSEWVSPTLGSILRQAFGSEHFWLQFVPMVFGGSWGIWYWLRHGAAWRWREHLPLLVLVSMATSAYGWNFDQVISLLALFPAVMSLLRACSSWKKWLFLSLYLVANALIIFTSFEQSWYWWVAPGFLCWWLAIRYAFPQVTALSGLLARKECL